MNVGWSVVVGLLLGMAVGTVSPASESQVRVEQRLEASLAPQTLQQLQDQALALYRSV